MEPVAFTDETTAWAAFYAVDPELGCVAVSALTTARELGLQIATRLLDGQTLLLDDGAALKRQSSVAIARPDGESRYRAAYTRSQPVRLASEIGYEMCVVHLDATVQARAHHFGYVLRLPGEDETALQERFFRQWGQATELPARARWADALWGMGLRMGLIIPLEAVGCEAWRVDPRWERPSQMGWRQVLELLVGLEDEEAAAHEVSRGA